MRTTLSLSAATLGAFFAAGCATDQLGLTTSSVTPETPITTASKVDPVCVSLAAQIEDLRKEGTIERLQKASEGKGATVQVKRTSLTKVAELNKATADFQARCSTITPRTSGPTTASISPVAPAATATAAAVNSVAATAVGAGQTTAQGATVAASGVSVPSAAAAAPAAKKVIAKAQPKL